MRRKWLVRMLALLAATSLAVPLPAKPISKNINLSQPARLGTTQLTAGDYHLLIDGTKVTVQRGRQLVAEVNGRWEQRENRSPYSSVLIGPNGDLQEVRFAGDKRVLVLSGQ